MPSQKFCKDSEFWLEKLEENGWKRVGGAYPTMTRGNHFINVYPDLGTPEPWDFPKVCADLVWVEKGKGVNRVEVPELQARDWPQLRTTAGNFNTVGMTWQGKNAEKGAEK